MSKLKIDLYSDILSIPAFYVDQRLERLKSRFGDKVTIDYHWVSIYSDTDSPDRRHLVANFYDHVQQLGNMSDVFSFNNSIWMDKIRTSSSGAHLFLKAIEIILSKNGQDPYATLHAVANRYRRLYFEDAEDLSNFLVLEKVLDEFGIDHNEVNQLIRSSEALVALIEDEKAFNKIDSHQMLPLICFNNGQYKLFGDVSHRVIENMLDNILGVNQRRVA